jgi:hypothetical protein
VCGSYSLGWAGCHGRPPNAALRADSRLLTRVRTAHVGASGYRRRPPQIGEHARESSLSSMLVGIVVNLDPYRPMGLLRFSMGGL